MLRRVMLFAVVLGLLAALLWYSQVRQQPATVSGMVEADEIRVGSRVGGRVHRVLAEEGMSVEAGQTLVELEPFDLNDREKEAAAVLAQQEAELRRLESGFRAEEVAQAQAKHDQLKAQLARLVAGPRRQEIDAAKAQVDVALAELELAQLTYRRTKEVFDRNAATRDEMDRAIEVLKSAQAMKQVREKQLDVLVEGTRKEEIEQARAQLEEALQAWKLAKNGYRREDVDRARAARDAAQAALAAIRTQQAELTITAPIRGVVEAVELQKGDLVSPGAPVLSIMDLNRLWVRAYVPGRFNVQLNQEIRITFDNLPERTFRGRVSFRSREAEFTPSNVQTPDERSQQVFRIKIELDGSDDAVYPGMTADVWLD